MAVIRSDDFNGGATFEADGYHMQQGGMSSGDEPAQPDGTTAGYNDFLPGYSEDALIKNGGVIECVLVPELEYGVGGALTTNDPPQEQSEAQLVDYYGAALDQTMFREGAADVLIWNRDRTVWAPGSGAHDFITFKQADYAPSVGTDPPDWGHAGLPYLIAGTTAFGLGEAGMDPGGTLPRHPQITMLQPELTEELVSPAWPCGWFFSNSYLTYVLPEFTVDADNFQRLQVEFRLASIVDGVLQHDGYICVRWNTGVVFSANDVPFGWPHTVTSRYGPANHWNHVTLRPQGVADNWVVRDDGIACPPSYPLPCDDPNAPPPTTPPCCANPGPGGGPFDPPPPGTPPPTTPPIIPPGGVPPSYTACTLGGDPAGASDPTDTQSLTDAVSPVVWLQLTLADATVLRFSAEGLPFTSGNGSTTTPRVVNWGPVSQTLADEFGSFEAMRTTVTLSDTDRLLRGHLASATNRNIGGREAILFIETRANAVSGTAPRVLARGVVTNWRANADLTIDLEISDPLGNRYAAIALDRPLPHRRIRQELFPECPDHNIGRAVPIIYGDYSDDFLWSVDPRIIPVGLVPVIYVGPAASIPGLGVGGEDHAFLICGHAIAGVQSVFASNLDPDGAGPVRMPTLAEFNVPGIGGWPLFHDVTGTDGITERFAIMTGIGPRADGHVEGLVPITLNVCGLEDNGDGSGDVISNIASQIQHFLTYFALQNYRTGTWGAVPTFPGGTPKVRTTSFDTIRTTHAGRVGGGYVGAWYIGHQQPTRSWLAELQIGSDIRLGIDHHGRILGVSLDEQVGSGGTSFDTSHIEESMFDVDPRVDGVYNVIDFECGQQASTGRFSWPVTQLRNEVSITDHSERIAQPITIMTTLIHAYAHDIASRRLARASQPIALVRFKVDLRGLALSIGQMITLTHYAGIGSDGWTTRTVMVTKITTDPNESELLVTIEAEDINDIATAGAFALDGAGLDVGVLA